MNAGAQPGVAKGVMSAATWQAGKIVASALAAPILARVLTPAGYGQYAYYLAIVMVAWPIANAGMLQVLSRYAAQRPDDAAWRKRIASVAGPANMLGTLLVGGAILGWLWLTANSDSARTAAVIVAVAIAFEQLGHFGRGVLYGARQDERANLPAAAGAVLGSGLSVVLALAGLGLGGALLGLALGNAFTGLVTAALAAPLLRGADLPQAAAPPRVRELLRFGLASVLFLTLSQALYRADAMLILPLAGAEQAGLYAAATQWSEFVWFLPLAVQSVMIQSTSRLWVEGRIEEIAALLNTMVRLVALGTALILIVIMLFADSILHVYFGPAFAGASLPLRVLAPGVFGYSLARILHPVIQARGNVGALLPLIAGAAALNVVLNILLMPVMGSVGAALSSCLTYGGLIFLYERQLRAYGVRAFAAFSLSRFALLCAGTALLASPALFIPAPLLAIAAGGAVSVVVFGLGALLLGLVSPDELRNLVRHLPKPLGRLAGRALDPITVCATRRAARTSVDAGQ